MREKEKKKTNFLTLIACCIKSMAIRRPNNSPAIRVNLLMMEQAPNTASKKSRNAVHTHTLQGWIIVQEVRKSKGKRAKKIHD